MSLLQIIFKCMLIWTHINFLLQKLKKFWVIIFTTKETLQLDFLEEIQSTLTILHTSMIPLVVFTVTFHLSREEENISTKKMYHKWVVFRNLLLNGFVYNKVTSCFLGKVERCKDVKVDSERPSPGLWLQQEGG